MRSDTDPKNMILCVSLNPEFPEEELPKNMIDTVWRVKRALINW
jgi:phage repressor protein C with HTH and peptisase S24 domain